MARITVDDATPNVDPTAWVAADATLVGDVVLGPRASVFYASVLRADNDRIEIGSGTNIQDGCVVHADHGFPVSIGTGVSVGHRAILHGCTVADDVLVGMGAIILNGATVGTGSIIAAGAVVLEGADIPAHSLAAGVPAKVRRQTTDEERAGIVQNALDYLVLSSVNAQGERATSEGAAQ